MTPINNQKPLGGAFKRKKNNMKELIQSQLRAAGRKLLKARTERKHMEAMEDIADLRQELLIHS